MIRKTHLFALAVLMLAVCCSPGWGQVPPTILEIELENWVHYNEDSSDFSKFATDPNVTRPTPPRNFGFRFGIADIVAVNGQPAKGTMTLNIRNLALRTAPNPGQNIADIDRSGLALGSFDILKTDGTPIGAIIYYGPAGGSPSPGAPTSAIVHNYAILGGTGAFLGVRGQAGGTQTAAPRQASITEDPANRRVHGGGRDKLVFQIIPMSVPLIVTTASGPAIAHSSDFSLVSASKPAVAGEMLSVFVTGLGPTTPGVDPGKPFPANPTAEVIGPVAVTVNGKPAHVLAAVSYPGAVDGYQVNFRLPPDTAKGVAAIQVSAAWITGPSVTIAVQ